MLEGSALSLFESKLQNFELAQLLTKIVVKMAIVYYIFFKSRVFVAGGLRLIAFREQNRKLLKLLCQLIPIAFFDCTKIENSNFGYCVHDRFRVMNYILTANPRA